MQVNAATGFGNAATAAPVSTRQDFMTLLVAQLKAQDPLEPMDPSEFMTQLAQLQMVSELTQIGETIADLRTFGSLGPALSLIGRTVHYHGDGGEALSATVDHIELGPSGCTVVAGGRQLTLSEIIAVE